MTTFAVVNSGSGAYLIDGNSNPTLSLTRGNTYTFNVNASGHPFWIKTANVNGTGSAYNNGVTNNGDDVGTISFAVPGDAPSTLYYICQYHSSMQGILSISGNVYIPYTETLTDNLSLIDFLSINAGIQLTDNVTSSDSLSIDAGIQLTDNVTLSDSFSLIENGAETLTDNLTLSDSLSVNYQEGFTSSVLGTDRIKDRVSELINSQLPEFIRTDNTTFVAFLKYYYKFLEQDQGALELVQNARQYSDIDKTTSSFVNYFLTNYANDLPISLQVNKSLLIKKIEGLYKSKGSTFSIETLFKVLYDAVATTSHPYDYVLRPSDGKWSFRTSIRVLLTSGSVTNLQDRFLNLVKNNITYTAEIVRVKTLATNLYEIFYKSLVDVPFEIDNDVFADSSAGTIFTGIVKPTTTSYQVSFGGTGFRVGEVFNLTVGGQDTLVRITKVGANGSIQTVKFINYGYNYSSNFTITLSNALGVAASTKYFDTTAGGFQESFTLIKVHSTIDATRYFDSDYVTPFAYTGNLLASSTTTSQIITSATTGGTSTPSDAIISFDIGAIARYPGEYIATQGFLSEPDVRLQDKNLYQPFAYQVVSELDISVFYDIVKKLVHQAGTNLFVNRVVSTTADISANVSVVTSKNVFTQLNSVFSTLDSKIYNMNKLLTDNLTSIESLTYNMNKLLTDNLTPIESLTYSLSKPISDSFTPSDSLAINFSTTLSDNINSLSDSLSAFTIFNLNPTDNVSISDNLNITFNAVLSDNVIPSESLDKVINLTGLSDQVTIEEGIGFGNQLTLNDSVGTEIIEDYTSNNYFAEVYTSTLIITLADSLSTAFLFPLSPTDNASISENLTVAFSTIINDSLSVTDQLLFGDDKILDSSTAPSDNINIISLQKELLDNLSVIETITNTIQKPISNADSIVTFTESGNGLILNYSDPAVGPSSYFSEIYVGETVLTIT